MADWRLLSNHGLTLICLARNPEMTLRQIGDWVGVTERTAHELTKQLCADGYLSRTQEAGRSRYAVHPEMPLRHPEMDGHSVGGMLAALIGGEWSAADVADRPPERRRKARRKDGAPPKTRRRSA